MNEEQIDYLIDKNNSLLLVMGVAVSVILDIQHHVPKKRKDIKWIMDAIENIVYLDKPPPPFPGDGA